MALILKQNKCKACDTYSKTISDLSKEIRELKYVIKCLKEENESFKKDSAVIKYIKPFDFCNDSQQKYILEEIHKKIYISLNKFLESYGLRPGLISLKSGNNEI
jgi:hypothetical protein